MTERDVDPDLPNEGRVRARRRLAVLAGSIALAAGAVATAAAIVIAGLPTSPAASPVAISSTASAGPTQTPHPTQTSTPTTTPTPTPTPTATPAPSPAPVAEPPAPVEDPADPSTWVIRFTGVGPVTLGTSFDEQRQLLPAFDDVTDPLCVSGQLAVQAPSGFRMLFVGGGDQPTSTAAITFGKNGATPTDDGSMTPRTAEGIGIDSTKDELFAAYPDIELTGMYHSEDYPYYGLTDGDGGWIVFALIHDEVSSIQIANEAVLPFENRSVKTVPSERCPA